MQYFNQASDSLTMKIIKKALIYFINDIYFLKNRILLKLIGMFINAETSDVSYKVNKDADYDEHIINCFKLLGKIIGKTIFERITMNAFFDRTLINYILGRNTTLEDIFFYDT